MAGHETRAAIGIPDYEESAESDHPGELRSIIYVRDTADRARWEHAAVDFCEQQHYAVIGLVIGMKDDDRWDDVMGLLLSGAAELVVVAERDQLPPNRTPRIEIVAECLPSRAAAGTRYRRPRVMH